MRIKTLTILTGILLMMCCNLNAQQMGNPAPVTQEEVNTIVKNTAGLIEEKYVFPETAAKLKEMLTSNLASGKYADIKTTAELAQTLTADMYVIAKDKHLSMFYGPKLAEDLANRDKSGPGAEEEFDKKQAEQEREQNFFFKKVEILPGNIGYIKLNKFSNPHFVKETVAAAMKFIENTDAVIIDLTDNGGGDAETVQMMCSYFFDENPRLLNSLYFREGNKTDDFYTLKEVNGKRRPDVPLYILTSSYTFSGAEEFSNDMKTQNRATIVGETTGGGANPNGFFTPGNGFVISISIGKAINPITKSNWEGTGVEPDIKTTKNKALETAQYEALKLLSSKTNDPQKAAILNWEMQRIDAEINPPDLTSLDLNSYAGSFGQRIVTYENGTLYYERKGVAAKKKLVPFAKDIFAVQGVDYFRLRYDRNTSGEIVSVTGLYDNGQEERSEKSN